MRTLLKAFSASSVLHIFSMCIVGFAPRVDVAVMQVATAATKDDMKAFRLMMQLSSQFSFPEAEVERLTILISAEDANIL